jgi:hypothetical protein
MAAHLESLHDSCPARDSTDAASGGDTRMWRAVAAGPGKRHHAHSVARRLMVLQRGKVWRDVGDVWMCRYVDVRCVDVWIWARSWARGRRRSCLNLWTSEPVDV